MSAPRTHIGSGALFADDLRHEVADRFRDFFGGRAVRTVKDEGLFPALEKYGQKKKPRVRPKTDPGLF